MVELGGGLEAERGRRAQQLLPVDVVLHVGERVLADGHVTAQTAAQIQRLLPRLCIIDDATQSISIPSWSHLPHLCVHCRWRKWFTSKNHLSFTNTTKLLKMLVRFCLFFFVPFCVLDRLAVLLVRLFGGSLPSFSLFFCLSFFPSSPTGRPLTSTAVAWARSIAMTLAEVGQVDREHTHTHTHTHKRNTKKNTTNKHRPVKPAKVQKVEKKRWPFRCCFFFVFSFYGSLPPNSRRRNPIEASQLFYSTKTKTTVIPSNPSQRVQLACFVAANPRWNRIHDRETR